METQHLTIARFTDEEFTNLNNFLQECKSYLENHDSPSMHYAYNEYQWLDKDDPDRILIDKIFKQVADDEGLSVDDVDPRIVMYEYLSRKWTEVAGRHFVVMINAHVLRDTFTDPTEDSLCWADGLRQQHVANEQ